MSFAANIGGSAAVAAVAGVPASCSDGSTPVGTTCRTPTYSQATCTTGMVNRTRTGCDVPAVVPPPIPPVPAPVFTPATCVNGTIVYTTNADSCAVPTYSQGIAAQPAVPAVPKTQCSERSVVFTINGGVTPYTLSSSLAGVTPSTATISTSPSNITLTFPTLNVGVVVTITAVDAKGALFTATATCAAAA